MIEEKLTQEELEYLYKLVEMDYKYHTEGLPSGRRFEVTKFK